MTLDRDVDFHSTNSYWPKECLANSRDSLIHLIRLKETNILKIAVTGAQKLLSNK
jgi:hypothetical protein